MESFKKVAQELLDEITGMLSGTDPGAYEALVNALLSAKQVIVAGDGRCRWVAAGAAARLSALGRAVSVEGEATARPAARGDLLIVASASGKRGRLTALADEARGAGAQVYVLVGEQSCVLASFADRVIAIAPQTRTPFEIIGGGRASVPAFDEAVMIYLDAALIALAEVQGIAHERFGK